MQLYTLEDGELKTTTRFCTLKGGELKTVTQQNALGGCELKSLLSYLVSCPMMCGHFFHFVVLGL